MKTFKELSIESKELHITEVNMSKANRDQKAKKMAKKVAIAKKKKKCSGNMTPSVSKVGNQVKVKCTPKDRTRSRTARKAAKRMVKSDRRKRSAKATATRKFRR